VEGGSNDALVPAEQLPERLDLLPEPPLLRSEFGEVHLHYPLHYPGTDQR
jgi:hypothetical protein